MVWQACLFLAGLWLILAAPAHGDIYKYVDKDGVVHFTNTPSSPEYVLYMREKRFDGRLCGPGHL
jgi:hypothetical protein